MSEVLKIYSRKMSAAGDSKSATFVVTTTSSKVMVTTDPLPPMCFPLGSLSIVGNPTVMSYVSGDSFHVTTLPHLSPGKQMVEIDDIVEYLYSITGGKTLIIHTIESEFDYTRFMIYYMFWRYRLNEGSVPTFDNMSPTYADIFSICLSIPSVVNIRGTRKNPVFTMYVGRSQRMGGWNLQESKWHNPKLDLRVFKAYVLSRIDLMSSLSELSDQILGCWCIPEPCHAMILRSIYVEYVTQPTIASKFSDI